MGQQIVLKSKKAFDSIESKGYMAAEASVWYPRKQSRDLVARKKYNDMFIRSSVSRKFASGDAGTIAGKSGAELARIVVEEVVGTECDMPYENSFEKSPEYWTGWALAYYQWISGDDFFKNRKLCADR